MADSITTIQFLFDYLGQKSYRLIDKEFIQRCLNELKDILCIIPKSERQNEQLRSLLSYVHKGSWTEAFKILPKAEAEYRDLTQKLHKIHCHKDINTPSVYIAEQSKPAKHETTIDVHGKDNQTVNIHDQNMKRPNDGHKSDICIEGCKQNQPQKLEDSKFVHVQGQSNCSENDQENATPNHDNGNALSVSSRTHASRDASNQLKQNNPNIADLSDPHRSTKLAERFSELYDNEWTNAYEALFKEKVDETSGVKVVLEIVNVEEKISKSVLEMINYIMSHIELILLNAYEALNTIPTNHDFNAYNCCIGNAAHFIFKEIGDKPTDPSGDSSALMNYRKSIAGLSVNRLQKSFREGSGKLQEKYCRVGISKTVSKTDQIVLFANKCVELCWWMCVQDPLICLDAATDPGFNSTLYRAYTKSGTSVEFYVWPALMLYKGGPVLMKGVAQCK